MTRDTIKVEDGFLIPGEVTQGNCYKVFSDGKQVAVVKNSLAAEAFITMRTRTDAGYGWSHIYTYQLAFIENIGF